MSEQVPSSTAGPAPSGVIRVRSRRRELVADGDEISVGGKVFRLDEVNRVAYSAAARINQAIYTIGLAQGGSKSLFLFEAYRRGTEMEDMRATWRKLVALLEATACPRIAQSAVRGICAGDKISFGNRIDADAEGLRPFKLFAKKVPWSQVTGADLDKGVVRVWTAVGAGTESKPRMSVDMGGWNAVVLPRVIARLGSH
jgi:hypothetical protein